MPIKYGYNQNVVRETVASESFVVPMTAPFIVTLAHIPKDSHPSTVLISGLVETEGVPDAGEFKVNYTSRDYNTFYVDGGPGTIEFNAAQARLSSTVAYEACGTAIRPEHINVLDTAAARIPTIESAICGDLVLVVTPATLGSSAAVVTAAIAAAAAKFSRNVTITLKTAAGATHSWFNGTFAVAVAKTGAGTVALAGGVTVATFVNGVATVAVESTGAWVTGNTSTLTVTGGTLLGFTVANKTSVDTLIA